MSQAKLTLTPAEELYDDYMWEVTELGGVRVPVTEASFNGYLSHYEDNSDIDKGRHEIGGMPTLTWAEMLNCGVPLADSERIETLLGQLHAACYQASPDVDAAKKALAGALAASDVTTPAVAQTIVRDYATGCVEARKKVLGEGID